MSSNYILARAKNEELRTQGACGGAVSALFEYLLDQKIVEGVLTLAKGEDVYDGIPTLLTEPSQIKETCGSLHCAPTMVADLVARFLPDNKIAVATKPCDSMAVNELKKRNQIKPENIYEIGLNCGGTVMPFTAEKMIELFYEIDPSRVVKEEIDKGNFIIELDDGTHKAIKIDDLEEEGYGRRKNCQRCDIMVPRIADVACGNWGSEDGWTFIEINTKKGNELVDNAKKMGYLEAKSPSDKSIAIRDKVENIMIKMAQKFQDKLLETEYPDTDKWNEYWNQCIKCYGCRDVCPVCWCRECELEKEFYDDKDEAPPNPLTFQGIRLAHMAFSCVNCGQCEDVCPMEIPVSRIYNKVQKKYQKKTGYVAGISDDLPPLYSPEKD